MVSRVRQAEAHLARISNNNKMNRNVRDRLKGMLIVPAGLAIVLVPYSLLIGRNLLTVFLFWFVITPTLTIYLPTIISKNKNHFLESLLGLMIFYGLMVFMIYDHYKTDFFRVMIFSCFTNLILIGVITWTQRMRAQHEKTGS